VRTTCTHLPDHVFTVYRHSVFAVCPPNTLAHMTVQRVACVETFTLPSTATEADGLASDLGVLATATEWKRAAIIHARVTVRDRRGRPDGQKLTNDLLTPDDYAALGVHGLRSATTVRRYWRAWQRAVDDGLTVPACLGGTVKLPTADWADYYLPDIPDPDPDRGESSNLGTLLAGDLLRVLAVKTFAATDRDNPLAAVKFEATSSQLIAINVNLSTVATDFTYCGVVMPGRWLSNRDIDNRCGAVAFAVMRIHRQRTAIVKALDEALTRGSVDQRFVDEARELSRYGSSADAEAKRIRVLKRLRESNA
jgi:hypothetical protein